MQRLCHYKKPGVLKRVAPQPQVEENMGLRLEPARLHFCSSSSLRCHQPLNQGGLAAWLEMEPGEPLRGEVNCAE